MRLQILVQRHSLPPVQIVHATGTGPASHTKSRDSTIADLLHDVNDLVPLESSDGEWGLEDYVVEVAAAADQALTYECLHFQACEAVLREDDEVIIRALSSEELRVRRLGGRHQITADGRHLIDGITFGKQWLRKTNRPGIVIPPRKKRRLLAEEPHVGSEEDLKQILPAQEDYTRAVVTFTGGEEDEELDEDYVDESPRQISVREEFIDADAELEDESEQPDEAQEDVDEDISPEVQLLLQDAADIEKATNGLVAKKTLEKQLKRKRDIDDNGEADEDDTFEGFSTLVKATGGAFVEDQDEDDPDITSGSGTSTSGSDADSMMEEIAIQQAKKRALNLIRVSEGGSSSESESYKEDSTSSSDVDVDDNWTSSSGSDTSDPDSDDESESESETSSESESEVEAEIAKVLEKPSGSKAASVSTLQTSTKIPGNQPAATAGVPFQGKSRTTSNNDRAKKRKRLNALKQQGLLPEHADFKALAAYEDAQQRKAIEADEETVAEQEQDGPTQPISEGKEVMTDKEVNGATHNDAEMNIGEELETADDPAPASASHVLEIAETSSLKSQPVMEPAPKRTRLDLASSRRMLFSSLGLRAPKTPEEEQALREKLSNQGRQTKQHTSLFAGRGPTSQAQTPASDDDSWENKLVVAAVECERPGVVLPPPPFPFQQGWSKATNGKSSKTKRRARDSVQFYQRGSGQYDEEDQGSFAPDVSTLNYEDDQRPPPINDTKTPTANGKPDDAPVPGNLDSLPDLDQAKIVPGAIIAYKELHVDASTNYQPEVSRYRVAHVLQVDEDGTVHVQLAKSSIESPATPKNDERIDKKAFGFELQIDDDNAQVDDGTREISFPNMISARLFKASSVEVPDSSHFSALRGKEASKPPSDSQFALIPESTEKPIDSQAPAKPQITIDEIATPRRNEITDIIKEAGFESALDNQLLQPIRTPAEDSQQTDNPDQPPSQSPEEYPHRFRRKSPDNNVLQSEKPSSETDDYAIFDDAPASADAIFDSTLLGTSSPMMHTQETVEYPHISQMEINSSEHVRTTNSSSHQDAQKVSPAPAVELSFSVSEQDKQTDEGGAKADELDGIGANEEPIQQQESSESLKLDVPLSQSQELPSKDADENEEESSDGRNSFLGGRGYDGHGSSYHDDDLSDEESDLPSLSEIITGSQKDPRRTRATLKNVSPPPVKKSQNIKTTHKSTPPSSCGSPLLSQPANKLSQGQSEPRLSQIQAQSQVIDLTISSNPASPVKDDYDFNDGKKKTGSQANGARKLSSRAAKQDSGIGTRRLLTTKKTRSYH